MRKRDRFWVTRATRRRSRKSREGMCCCMCVIEVDWVRKMMDEMIGDVWMDVWMWGIGEGERERRRRGRSCRCRANAGSGIVRSALDVDVWLRVVVVVRNCCCLVVVLGWRCWDVCWWNFEDDLRTRTRRRGRRRFSRFERFSFRCCCW